MASYFTSDFDLICSRLQGLLKGCVAQSVTCLATDATLTADPGVASSIPPSLILSWRLIMKYFLRAILLPATESFKKGCCQLQAKVCAGSTG